MVLGTSFGPPKAKVAFFQSVNAKHRRPAAFLFTRGVFILKIACSPEEQLFGPVIQGALTPSSIWATSDPCTEFTDVFERNAPQLPEGAILATHRLGSFQASDRTETVAPADLP